MIQLCEAPRMSAASCSGTWFDVRIQAKTAAEPTMNRTTAVVSIVSKETRRKRRQESVR